MSLNNENGIKKQEIDEENLSKIDNLVQNISMNIRKNNRYWLKGEGKCEVCGLRFAEIKHKEVLVPAASLQKLI